MTKSDLINEVYTAANGDLTKKATGDAVQIVFDQLALAIKNDGKFSYPGFGTFTMKTRAARNGRNPRTGETIKIKASKNIGFKAAPSFKSSL